MRDTELLEIIKESNKVPVLIMDFNVLLWKIISFVDETSLIYKNNRENIIKLATAYIFNRGPIGLPIMQFRAIVVADGPSEKYGGYWRHYEVERDERINKAWDKYKPKKKIRTYKGGRLEKDKNFYEIYGIVKDYCKKYLNFYRFDGYEADDIAGEIFRCEKLRDKNRIKIFYTVDRDWNQLINEEYGYYWYTPRVPKENEIFQEQGMNNKDVLLYAEKKLGMTITNPQELILAKVENGDLGDNLPPETPIEYMDLTVENKKYSIKNEYSDLYTLMIEDILNMEPNNRLDHLDECQRNFSKLNLEFKYRG